MIKQYFNSSDERELKVQSMIMFREISSGVYHVEKDRLNELQEYVSEGDVVTCLNYYEGVAVTGSRGIFANFELKNM